jgi:pimeloyl-ACP methyl ester carboxylesterase
LKKWPLLVALAACEAARRLRRAAPGAVSPKYRDFVPDDYPPELFEVPTEDGLVLRGKRYANPGAQPLILMAGFSGNGFNYDIAVEKTNFALYMARKGYDVWVANFRATGRKPYRSDSGDYSHHIQDLCIYDAPALVSVITERTGMKPVIFGHSMGGVVCYGYLQGADYRLDEGVRRLVSDPDLARERNEAVAGVVSLAGPASFYWPMTSRYYWLVASPVSRLFLRAFTVLLRRLSARPRPVPIEDSVVGLIRRAPRLAYLVLRAGYYFFANLENIDPEMMMESAVSGMSDVSVREQFQLVDALLTRDLIASPIDGALEGEPHNMTRHMHMITAPILFVAAELDAVHPAVLYRDGFEQVGSQVKEYKCFTGYGHVDLIQGYGIRDTVLPYVARWLGGVLGEPREREEAKDGAAG